MRSATEAARRTAAQSHASSARSCASCPSGGRMPAAGLLRALARTHRARDHRRAHRRRPRPTRRSSRASVGSGPRSPPESTATVAPVVGTEVWNASDPDDEVRTIVRGVVDAMREGVPLERMAVLYASDEPYARLLHEHFDLAGDRAQRRLHAIDGGFRPRPGVAAHVRAGRHRLPPRRRVRAVRSGTRARRARPARPGRQMGTDLARTRESCAGSTEWRARLDAHDGRLPDDETRRTIGRARRDGARAQFVDRPRRRSRPRSPAAHVERAGAVRARARAPVLRRRGAAGGVAAVRAGRGRAGSKPCSTGSARSTRSIPARPRGVPPLARARARRGARSRRPARRRRARRPGRRWRSASSSTGCGCAGWPKECSRASRATIRCSLTATGPCSGASCACAPIAPPTTSGACSRRSHRPSDARVCTLSARRSAAQHRARPVAVPRRRRSAAVRRASTFGAPSFALRRHARRVPREPPRARRAGRGGGEPWVRGRARGRAGSRARASRGRHPRSPASTATSRTSAHALRGDSPAAPDQRVVADPAQSGRSARTRTSCRPAARRSGRAAGGDHAAHADRPRHDRARGPRPVPRRAARRARRGRPWTESDQARLRAIAEEVSAAAEARGVTGRRLLWHRDRRVLHAQLDAFLDSDEEYRADGARRRSRPSSTFGAGGRRRRRRGRARRRPGGAACGARPTASTASPTAGSW